MPMIDQIMIAEKRNIPESLDKVFAAVEPMFLEIEKLKSNDLAAQRNAARELARLGALSSPSKLAAKRMVEQAAKQNDPLILTSIFTALQNADPELVRQLARPLLQSEAAGVRRVSCEMLKEFGTNEDVVLLQELLHDSSRGVKSGALAAIDVLLEEADADSPVFETLKSMLLQSDPELQTAIAAILHRLGHQEGTDTFRRLAVSSDHRSRMYVAQMVPNDPVFVPLLIRFLDDSNGTVRSEALKVLPKLTGQDIGRSGSTQEQIDAWKAWEKAHLAGTPSI
jgi:HEAT repeat protein